MKKHTIIIITECPYAGILRAIIENSKNFFDMGFKIQFIIPEVDRDRYGEKSKQNIMDLKLIGKVIKLPIKKGYLSIYTNTKILKKYLKTINYPIIISYGSYAGKISRLLFKNGSINKLYHVPQCIDLPRMNFFSKILEYTFEKILAPYASYYLACSPSESFYINKKFNVPQDKIIFFPNAISSKDSPPDSPIYQFIFVGRLVKSKGVKDILNAFNILGMLNKIIIIGDGPELLPLKKEFPQANLIGHVPNKNIKKYLANSKFFISNSIIEGLPFSTLEAMQLGIVPILSDVDGHADIITHAQNGFLFSNIKGLTNILFKMELISKEYYDLLSRNAKITSQKCLIFSKNNLINHFKQYE